MRNSSRTNYYNRKHVIREGIDKFKLLTLCPCSKKFLIEHLPADQVTSPQKAHELAVRFENHVALSTTTKVHNKKRDKMGY